MNHTLIFFSQLRCSCHEIHSQKKYLQKIASGCRQHQNTLDDPEFRRNFIELHYLFEIGRGTAHFSACFNVFNVTYPRFGPFGARNGRIIPTKPQKAEIKITGSQAISIRNY